MTNRFGGVENVKVAIVGSRGLWIENLSKYLPEDVTEIISGGARGIDACAREYALASGIPLREFLPDYRRYGKAAPLKRNMQILENCDFVLAFWDGRSGGTGFVIRNCEEQGIPLRVVLLAKAAEGRSGPPAANSGGRPA